MKKSLIALAVIALSGCAGMSTQWVWQARIVYETPQDTSTPAPPTPVPPLPAGKPS